MGYRYRVVPIGYEGFVQPRKGQGSRLLICVFVASDDLFCNHATRIQQVTHGRIPTMNTSTC